MRDGRRLISRCASAAASALLGVAAGLATADTVSMTDIDSGTTSSSGQYRWLDIANQVYAGPYRTGYDYTQAIVHVEFPPERMVLRGTLTATNLKPNFAYQLKLVGTPGSESNEGIGLAGRWWQEEWDGSQWSGGGNLNNKGDGSSPNPNDNLYFARRDLLDPTSPTGRRYRYTAYFVMAYFITDDLGNAVLDFAADSSYHVLWKTSQRSPTASDGPQIPHTFNPNPALHPAYATDYPQNTVTVFGEWERLPVGGVRLRPGAYPVQIMLTEESFHGSGGGYAGNWAAAMGADMLFAIVESRKGDFDSDDDIDFADFMEFVDVHGLTDADPGWNDDVRIGDFNDDGGIDLSDFTLFTDAYGT